ncbi:MAG: hypothetical protein RLN89_06460 [Parvibaculum sp.]
MAFFLYRDQLVELDTSAAPQVRGDFPLNDNQYEQITIPDLMQLLTEGLADNPRLAEEEPKFVLAICHMLFEKGEINAIRVKDDGLGPVLSCAKVPDQSLIILDELRMRGALDQAAVDAAVWNPLA